jgi:hypothetical protein
VNDVWTKTTACESNTCVEVAFFKSTRSGTNGACVEVAFVKSNKSGPHTDNCVEVATCTCGIQVRDSKDQSGPVLNFTHAEWDAFLAGVRDGEFDL